VALHVLYQLVLGLERVHAQAEYHSDVHSQNVMIRPHGVSFELKLVDFYNWGRPSRAKQQQDIVDTIRLFYDILGGGEHYPKLSAELRSICAGLKESLILRRFPTMNALRVHLERFRWQRVPG
jgi:serine/threonine protein kinase